MVEGQKRARGPHHVLPTHTHKRVFWTCTQVYPGAPVCNDVGLSEPSSGGVTVSDQTNVRGEYLILSESDGRGMCAQAASCMIC